MATGVLRRALGRALDRVRKRRPPARRTGRRGTYNLDNNRDKAVVVGEVLRLLRLRDPDWATVVEAGGYVRALRKPLRRAGYRLYRGHGTFSRRDSAVIVRAGIKTDRKRVHSLGGVRWERDPKSRRRSLHPPRHAVSVRVQNADGSYRRVGALHLPPGPHDMPNAFPRRGKAFRVALDKVGRITAKWDHNPRLSGWEWLGDINAAKGRPEIVRFLADHDARAIGTGIDYAITDADSDIEDAEKLELGDSDHKPRIFHTAKENR